MNVTIKQTPTTVIELSAEETKALQRYLFNTCYVPGVDGLIADKLYEAISDAVSA